MNTNGCRTVRYLRFLGYPRETGLDKALPPFGHCRFPTTRYPNRYAQGVMLGSLLVIVHWFSGHSV